jgi:hypothetical protein
MVSQRGTERPQGTKGPTPEGIVRRHSHDGTPTGAAASTADSFELMSLLETSWADNRRPRTAHRKTVEPTTSDVDANRAPRDTKEHNVALTSKQSVKTPNAAGVSMGQIEDILRKLLDAERSKDRERERERSRLEHDPRYLLRELQAANERNQRQELALREKDDALRRMREDLPRYQTDNDSRSSFREGEEPCLKHSDPRDYGRPRALGGGYREAAARASARVNERESRAHCLSTGKDYGVKAVVGNTKFNIA